VAYDQVRICNVALSHCAASRFLDTVDDGTTEGDLCKVHYAPARDEVLAAHHWPFARRFVALALHATADGTQDWSDEWGFAYRYPADCARIRRVLTGCRSDGVGIPFELGSDAAGKLVFTDEAQAKVSYTHLVTDTTLFSDAFCQAVAWRMAWHMAMPLSARVDLRQQAEQGYARALADAKVLGAGEQLRDPESDAGQIRARG
jgi:hypothetical protein